MNALILLALVLVAGAVAVGLRLLVGLAESRRNVRWSHTLTRFCGDSGCGVCRSRELSRGAPRFTS